MRVMGRLKLSRIQKTMMTIWKEQVRLENDSSVDAHLSKELKKESTQVADRVFSKSKNKIKILELGLCSIRSGFSRCSITKQADNKTQTSSTSGSPHESDADDRKNSSVLDRIEEQFGKQLQPLESEQKRAERIERIQHEKQGLYLYYEPDRIIFIQNWKHSKKNYV